MDAVGLEWSIKLSFLRYVGGSGGQASVTHGGSMTGPNVFCFPPAGPPQEGSMAFVGDVRFSAHAGMLFVRIAHPTVEVGPERMTLVVDDPVDTSGSGTPMPLVDFLPVREEAPDGLVVWRGVDVRLTEQGSELFNGVYPPGEPFEDLRITMPAT